MKDRERVNVCGTCGDASDDHGDCGCDSEVTNSVAYLEENENENDT